MVGVPKHHLCSLFSVKATNMLMIEGLDPLTLLAALEDPHYDASRSVERERDDVPASSTPEGGPLQDE